MSDNQTGDRSRVNQRIPVRFGLQQPTQLGFIKNLSIGGVAITSRVVYKPQTRLLVMLQHGLNPITLRGVVRWTTDLPPSACEYGANRDMGIEFTERHKLYLDMLGEIVRKFSENRQEARFEKIFKVSFEDPQDLLREYTQNISLGGMFVITDRPPEINSLIEVHISVKDLNRTIKVMSRVVFILKAKEAEGSGANPGIGVQFTEFLENDREVFESYISDLETKLLGKR